jgi:hypothetical protein
MKWRKKYKESMKENICYLVSNTHDKRRKEKTPINKIRD